jgi:hypothetical protein
MLTVIGPDGTIFTLNGGTLWAPGNLNGVGVAVSSSTSDVRSAVVGQPLTFTASVINTGGSGPTPGGNRSGVSAKAYELKQLLEPFASIPCAKMSG